MRTWQGGIFLWGEGTLFAGRAGKSDLHAPHAVQITVAAEDRFRLKTHRSDSWSLQRAVLIPSDCPHELDGSGAILVSLYLDPESDEARRLVAPDALPETVTRAADLRRALRGPLRPSLPSRDRPRVPALGALAALGRSGARVGRQWVAHRDGARCRFRRLGALQPDVPQYVRAPPRTSSAARASSPHSERRSENEKSSTRIPRILRSSEPRRGRYERAATATRLRAEAPPIATGRVHGLSAASRRRLRGSEHVVVDVRQRAGFRCRIDSYSRRNFVVLRYRRNARRGGRACTPVTSSRNRFAGSRLRSGVVPPDAAHSIA